MGRGRGRVQSRRRKEGKKSRSRKRNDKSKKKNRNMREWERKGETKRGMIKKNIERKKGGWTGTNEMEGREGGKEGNEERKIKVTRIKGKK